ncbi:hypothetical protein K435DRAFT_710817 [Dendrothele bispora CBS 962.96]|uniref:Uncharacterized protein n=1 Tax=Dendrothele bispora (strain CBS 962.96) TaxID=1314807 RepID=A0A4S8MUD4_DENBC|nr:hypothetical protein K435DRAFT_710817 [Dendrothele bispora CBS 962.96]
MSEKSPKPPLHTPTKPRRQNSVFKCCIWTFGLIALSIGGFIGYCLYDFFIGLHQELAHPHSHLYQNQSLSEVSNRSLVVQPLVGKEQTFDIAVSVWIRALQAEEEKWKAGLGESRTDLESGQHKPLQFLQNYKGMEEKVTIHVGFDEDEFLHGEKRELYHPLYSDIVFRGLRSSDKGVTTSINFTIPTQKFREPKLTGSELRASLLLIPTSPSLMDSVVNYSNWIPEELRSKIALKRTWPFPMGSEYMGEKSIADLAVESSGVFVPLVQFYDIPSRCPSAANDAKSDSGDDPELENNVIMDANGNIDFTEVAKKLKLNQAAKTEKHPHIITWSQIRLIDEKHIMNLEAYDEAHEKLKKTSCGQNLKANQPIKPLQRLCDSSYVKTGPLKTKLQLETEDTKGDKHTEWAYGPYLTTFSHAPGPMDLIPVPVDRENCTDKVVLEANSTSTFDHTDADSMDVTWHISFSGRSPLMHVGETLTIQRPVNHSQSDHDKAYAQNIVELSNGIHGVSKPYTHPRRRILLTAGVYCFNWGVFILSIIYWYTRNNTVFISVPGLLLSVAAEICSLIPGSMKVGSINGIVLLVVLSTPRLFFKLRTALRIELEWRGWTPTLRRTHPSHRERASHRLDMALGWYPRLASVCFLFAFFFFIPTSYQTLIPPLPHSPQPSQTDSKRLEWYANIGACLADSLIITGTLSQVILNHKSKHFSGMYKSHAFLASLSATTSLLHFIPAFVGRSQIRSSLTLNSAMKYLINFAMVYQALTLPAVEPTGPDEDEE